jgi:hypothetical protein
MLRPEVGIKVLTIVLLTVFTAFAQSSARLPVTDEEKIADAMRAGPAFITKEYRILRKGSNEWTCLPGVPLYPHDEPGCFDAVFLHWMQDSLAGRTPHIDRIGISYMYMGAVRRFHPDDRDFHVGPHLMIVSPHQEEFQHLNRDGSNGMAYVTHLPNRSELFLVIPIRQWSER